MSLSLDPLWIIFLWMSFSLVDITPTDYRPAFVHHLPDTSHLRHPQPVRIYEPQGALLFILSP